MTGTAVAAHKGEIEGYSTSKGTIRFRPAAPLPISALVLQGAITKSQYNDYLR